MVTALLPLVLWASGATLPEPLQGRWEGAVVRDNAVQALVVRIEPRDGGLFGTYDIPDLNLYGEPLEEVRRGPAGVELRFKYGRFAGSLHEDADEITASNASWGPPVALHLKHVPDAAPEFDAEEVRFGSKDSPREGTIYRPATPGPHPGVVVVHGSGSGGREQWEYRGLGPMFARMGVAALVYDKREEATFEALADDAAAAVAFLARRPGIARDRVGLFGSSQGGWLAPLAASKAGGVAFLVLEKGAAVTVAEQEVHRVAYTLRAEGIAESEVREAIAYTEAMLRAAEGKESFETVAALGEGIRGRPWAEHVQLLSSPRDLEGWRRERYDPAPVLRRTTVPVLALFGEKDTLVPPAENLDKMRRYLADAGNRDATLVVLPGEGHNRYRGQHLCGDRWEWPGAYWVWDRISPREVRTIQDWLQSRLNLTRAASRPPRPALPAPPGAASPTRR